MQKSFFALAFLTVLAFRMAFADSAAIEWKRLVRLTDGRTFVTDGSFTIDTAIAKPSEPPKNVLAAASAKLVEGYLAALLPDEFALDELKSGRPGTYESPSGVTLNAVYVDYLRRVLPPSTLRFRMKGDLEPVVVLSSGTAVGLVMPMKR
jgi:hypothetical protein